MKMGVLEILGIVFIVLKLCGVIHWHWVWVLAPFWIAIAIIGISAIFATIDKKTWWKKIIKGSKKKRNDDRRAGGR